MENWHPNPDFFFLPGAGPVLDIGPYYIANLIQLIGPVKRVGVADQHAAEGRTITTKPRDGEKIPVKTPTTIHALLEFVSGADVTLGTSWDVWSHGHAPWSSTARRAPCSCRTRTSSAARCATPSGGDTVKKLPKWEHPLGGAQPGASAGHDGQLPHRRPRRHGDGHRRRAAASLLAWKRALHAVES